MWDGGQRPGIVPDAGGSDERVEHPLQCALAGRVGGGEPRDRLGR